MKVSVVTPVYNDPRVEHALTSIEAQSHPDVESIVIDGASDEATLDILKAHKRSIVISEPDEGIYDAMNKGLRKATGDVIAILNADDTYAHPDVIAHAVQAFEETHAALVYGDLEYVDRDGKVVRRWHAGAMKPGSFRRGWMPPHPTCFVRREVYEKVGHFDTSLPIAADYDFLLRTMVKHRVPVHYLEETLVKMGAGGTSNAGVRNILQANLEVRRSWKKNGLRGGALAPILKPLRKPLQYMARGA